MDRSSEIGLYGVGMKGESHPRESQMTRWASYRESMRFKVRLGSLRVGSALKSHRLVPMLIVLVAAIFVLSAVATMPAGKAIAAGPEPNQAPPPPYYVAGYTYDAFGVKIPGCDLNITNVNTGAWNLTMSNVTTAFFRFDLRTQDGGVAIGDLINITATKDVMIGWNESVVPPTGSFLSMNVTLDGIIPEFPMAVLPVLGVVATVALAGRRRKARK